MRHIRNNTITRVIAVMGLWFAAMLMAGATEIKGRVMDVTSQTPVKGATVKLSGSDHTAITDARGNFFFSQLAAAPYTLSASAPGYYELTTKVSLTNNDIEYDLFLTGLLTSSTTISVTGSPEPIENTTRSVGVASPADVATTRLFTLDEFLNAIPGVRADTQSNTENTRVAIRGRGVRTSFGMRGIKVLVDGIPESDASGELPDLTGLDMGAVERAEVVKGPMSAEYGANSGGVLNLITGPAPGTPEITFDNIAGSYDYMRNQVDIGGRAKNFDYVLHGARVFEHGFRENSRLISYKYDGRSTIDLSSTTKLTIFLKGGLSDQQLPGNLTQDELDQNPNQAAALFLAFNGDTDIKRVQGAIRLDKAFSENSVFSATFFQRVLDFNLSVPFLFAEGHRPEFGTSLQYMLQTHFFGVRHKLTFGGEFQRQREDRNDFDNNAGAPVISSPQRDEIRRVFNTGGYVFDEIALTHKLVANLGLNYSQLHFNIEDFLAGNSGANTFRHVSYQAGAAYHFTDYASAYGSVSTGFETPTITELGRDPSGRPGVNLSLQPQALTNFEAGTMLKIKKRAYVNAAVFRTQVTNEIVPTGLGNPQGTFTNAAKTIHDGTELSFGSRVTQDVDFKMAYTHSDFYFDNFINVVGVDFSGNKIPALPRNDLNMAFTYHNRRGLTAGFNNEVVGQRFADDANSVKAPMYNLAGANFGFVKSFEKLRFRIMYGVANLFNENYVSYVVANDQFGSFFYPAPGRNHYGTASLTWVMR